jgi:hypothetical protein
MTKEKISLTVFLPEKSQAKTIYKEVSSDIRDFGHISLFGIKAEKNLLTIDLNDPDSDTFNASFLLSLSSLLKETLAPTDDEANAKFHFSGPQQSGVAMCLGSFNLWSASFSFEEEDEEAEFKALLDSASEMNHMIASNAPKYLKQQNNNY